MPGIELIRSDVDPLGRMQRSYGITRGIQTNQAEDAAANAIVQNQPEQADPIAAQRQSAIQSIASQPGGGQAALKAQQLDQNSRNAVSDKIYAGLKDGSPAALNQARALAQQSGINIPEEIFTDAGKRAYFTGFVDTAHKIAADKGVHVSEVLKRNPGATQNTSQNPQQAAVEAVTNTPEQRTPYTTYTTPSNDIGVITTGPSGVRAENLGVKGRTGKSATSQRGFEFDAKINAIAAEGQRRGMTPEDALGFARQIVLMKQNITPQDRLKVAANMMKATDRLGRPLYKTPADAQRAANDTIQWMSQQNIQMPAAPGTEVAPAEDPFDFYYDSLPSGTEFTAPDGRRLRKP